MSIAGLAAVIEKQTGATGAELEMLTFFVAASFADVLGRKDIGDYFDGRCQVAKAQLAKETAQCPTSS